jgi:hypothetical protein
MKEPTLFCCRLIWVPPPPFPTINWCIDNGSLLPSILLFFSVWRVTYSPILASWGREGNRLMVMNTKWLLDGFWMWLRPWFVVKFLQVKMSVQWSPSNDCYWSSAELVQHFACSSHRRKGAAWHILDLVWLYRRPILSGRRRYFTCFNDFYLTSWHLEEGRKESAPCGLESPVLRRPNVFWRQSRPVNPPCSSTGQPSQTAWPTNHSLLFQE